MSLENAKLFLEAAPLHAPFRKAAGLNDIRRPPFGSS